MSRGDHFVHPFVFNQHNVSVDDTNLSLRHLTTREAYSILESADFLRDLGEVEETC